VIPGTAVIVFDGYCNGPSMKDQKHQRRSLKIAPDIVVDVTKTAYFDQATLLANDHNKHAFVKLIITCFRSVGHLLHQAADDADTLTVKVALQLAGVIRTWCVSFLMTQTFRSFWWLMRFRNV
jgi:hypothetical protein